MPIVPSPQHSQTDAIRNARPPRWSWALLAATLLFAAWWRAHTFGPTVRDHLGFAPWPVVGAASEPIDCDEAVYTYVGRRLLRGDVFYRDLTDTKPPGGYWLYTLGVAVGGDDEGMVRLLPIPMVLATIALLWWIGHRLGGPWAANLAAIGYAVASCDPYLFGNGSNLEHPMNLGTVASLACVVEAWRRPDGGRRWLFAAGLAIGWSVVFKQVAALHAIAFGAALLVRGRAGKDRLLDAAALGLGVVVLPMLAALVLIAQGAGRASYEEVFTYAAAMARDVPAEPNAPPFWLRQFVGNADPRGVLPPPFGGTQYLVWWGMGTWPLWLVALPGAVLLLRVDAPRRLVALWTLAAWVETIMPRLFWQHYYLLPLPGIVLIAALSVADGRKGRFAGKGLAVAASLALLATFAIQVRAYLLVDPVELTVRYKGGGQWVALRRQGRDLARIARGWDDPRYFNWGWQSPIFVYSGMDGVTRHFFADPLMKAFGEEGNHPLIAPRLDRMMADLEARPPDVALIADRPFPRLAAFLRERYHVAEAMPEGRGLFVRKDRFGDYLRERPAPPAR